MPPRTEQAGDAGTSIPAPAMVAPNSVDFNDAVAAAVSRALASQPPTPTPAPITVGLPQPPVIQQTSLDVTKPGPDDLTVRFARFCTFQNSGYQRGQEAGFPRAAAEKLSAAGAAFIVYDPRRPARAA